MRKEILFAIFAGVTFGLIIAFGVWRANIALKPDGTKTTAPEDTSRTAQTDFRITIAKPQDYQVITTSPAVITGITKSNVWVIISAEEEDYVVKTDESGEFEIKVDVIGGVNEVIITAFNTDGVEAQEKLTLIYSSEFAKQAKGDN